VAAAGELAGAIGILPWPNDQAKIAANVCFQAWLGQRGGIGAQEIAAGLAQVRHFFQTHAASRFQPWDSADERIINNRTWFICQKDGTHTFIVFLDTFQKEICQGFDHRIIANELKNKGILLPDSQGRPTQSLRLPKADKTSRVYVFTGDIIAGDDL